MKTVARDNFWICGLGCVVAMACQSALSAVTREARQKVVQGRPSYCSGAAVTGALQCDSHDSRSAMLSPGPTPVACHAWQRGGPEQCEGAGRRVGVQSGRAIQRTHGAKRAGADGAGEDGACLRAPDSPRCCVRLSARHRHSSGCDDRAPHHFHQYTNSASLRLQVALR